MSIFKKNINEAQADTQMTSAIETLFRQLYKSLMAAFDETQYIDNVEYTKAQTIVMTTYLPEIEWGVDVPGFTQPFAGGWTGELNNWLEGNVATNIMNSFPTKYGCSLYDVDFNSTKDQNALRIDIIYQCKDNSGLKITFNMNYHEDKQVLDIDHVQFSFETSPKTICVFDELLAK